MKDIVIIKLYRNEYQNDDFKEQFWADEEKHNYLDKLKEFGKKINKEVYFCVLYSDTQTDIFAEIKYTGELSDEEKKYYTDLIALHSRDREPFPGTSRPKTITYPFTVFYERCPELQQGFVNK